MANSKSPYIRRKQKVRKNAPFDLSSITSEFPYISQLLSTAIGQLTELPDFSDDKEIAVMSDFGGEHRGAHFNTYSFLILAYDKIGPFIKKIEELRQKYGLTKPYSEFAFKDLSYGPRSRALPEFLCIVDKFIHGAVITIAIDKKISTVFGFSKRETHQYIQEKLSSMGLGKWKGDAGEKVLRICHSISLFTALMTTENQRLLWYCDNDSINDDARDRGFAHTQQIFIRTLGMYSKHKLDLVGFGKSFTGKSHLDDLLSIPDFAAGIVQDVLTSHKIGDENIYGSSEKEILLRWMAAESFYLSKIIIQVSQLENGELISGVVDFKPAIHN